MAKAKTPRLTSNSSSKQVITMPDAGSAVPVRKAAPAAAPTPIDLDAQIRQRAYEIYEERGCTPGQEGEDWLRAEREVLGRLRQPHTATA